MSWNIAIVDDDEGITFVLFAETEEEAANIRKDLIKKTNMDPDVISIGPTASPEDVISFYSED